MLIVVGLPFGVTCVAPFATSSAFDLAKWCCTIFLQKLHSLCLFVVVVFVVVVAVVAVITNYCLA